MEMELLIVSCLEKHYNWLSEDVIELVAYLNDFSSAKAQ